jgi:hypothetical protein
VVAMLNKGAGAVRCVKLRGEEGIGKTALVLKVCEYMRLRGAPCACTPTLFSPLGESRGYLHRLFFWKALPPRPPPLTPLFWS